MTERATAGPPLEIDRVERARAEGNCVRLRLAGRWLDPAAVDEEELLVVQIAGRRHRFPGTRDEQVPGDGKPDRLRAPGAAWSASFTLPDWAEPRHHGQAALWLGSAVVPVPHPEGAPSPPPPTLEQPILDEATDDAPRPAPVEDVVLKETVTALHTELAQRTKEAVRLRGDLADARSELETRIAAGSALEAAQKQLRAELGKVTAAVEAQRAERDTGGPEAAALREQLAAAQALAEHRAAEAVRLREELAVAQVARDAAVGEAAGLRSELERVGTELAAIRERVGAEGGDLGEAARLLADAKALAEQLRGA